MEQYLVGIDGEKAVSSEETKKQIEIAKRLECLLEDNGKRVTWDDFDNPENEEALFQKIIKDKVERVDKGEWLRTRPSYCVISVIGDQAVRLEYYADDFIDLKLDLRAKELQGLNLPKYMTYKYRHDLTYYLEYVKEMKDFKEYVEEQEA